MIFNKLVTTNYENGDVRQTFNPKIRYLGITHRYGKVLFDMETQKEIKIVEDTDFVPDSNIVNNALINSLKNPLNLFYDTSRKLYCSHILSGISTHVFGDTGNFILSVCLKTLGYSIKDNRAFIVKKSEKRINLYVDKETNIPKMFRNDKFCYTNKSLDECFAVYSTILRSDNCHSSVGSAESRFDFFTEMFRNDYLGANLKSCPKTTSRLLEVYRLKRSYKLLGQLPWDDTSLTNLYHDYNFLSVAELPKVREKILIQLRKGNTAKATDLCFSGGGYPKSIKKFMIKEFAPLTITPKVNASIHEAIKDLGVDKTRTLLETVDPRYITPILKLIATGFTFKHLMNVWNSTGTWLISDTVRLQERLEGLELPFNSNLRDYHDRINEIYVARRPTRNSNYIDMTKLYTEFEIGTRFIPLETESFIVRSPVNTIELDSVGNALHICVGSYKQAFFLKNLDIVFITDLDNKYLACIEVVSNNVVQAKLSRNACIYSNSELMGVLSTWAENNKLTLDCSDVQPGRSFPYPQGQEDCPERLEAYLNYRREFPGRQTVEINLDFDTGLDEDLCVVADGPF